ncbi:MAG TPA: EutN/CcmL family microcompartment protein [Candidatus Dormibacteraeota bacterium]|nr:EutN/CcmL family microcompartment protein [Candidatus Dormibacteraeota bacterium]
MARVVGTAVASMKEATMTGTKLLLVEDIGRDAKAGPDAPYVAVDLVGAGEGELVLVSLGSPAAKAVSHEGAAVDAAIVGIVDSLRREGKTIYQKD